MKSSLLCGALIIINTKLLYLQGVPGLLTCCHQMPDMDPHGAGPSIRTLLTGQDEHRSSLLWDAHLEGEVCTCEII